MTTMPPTSSATNASQSSQRCTGPSAHRAGVRTDRAEKARATAGQEIDRLSDPSATEEERQRRKRRLLKGPKEFRDVRNNRPTSNRAVHLWALKSRSVTLSPRRRAAGATPGIVVQALWRPLG